MSQSWKPSDASEQSVDVMSESSSSPLDSVSSTANLLIAMALLALCDRVAITVEGTGRDATDDASSSSLESSSRLARLLVGAARLERRAGVAGMVTEERSQARSPSNSNLPMFYRLTQSR